MMVKVIKRKFVVFFFSMLFLFAAQKAESISLVGVEPFDTLRLELRELERIFIEQNLILLAQAFSIREAEVLTKQARLWNNPEISIADFNPHTIPTAQLFDELPGRPQQFTLEIEQHISTARKRKRLVEMHVQEEQVQAYVFFDLMRMLKYELRTTFYRLHFSFQSIELLQSEIASLKKLEQAMAEQYLLDNIAKKELIRIRSHLLALQSELIHLKQAHHALQTTMRNLVNAAGLDYFFPLLVETQFDALTQTLPDADFLYKAMENRQDLGAEKAVLAKERTNYQYQRSLAIPNVTLSGQYDRWGGIGEHFLGIGLAVDLPLFDRNQHSISAADFAIQRQETQVMRLENQIQHEVRDAYRSYYETRHLLLQVDSDFIASYEGMYQHVLEAYMNRDIGIVALMDFFQTYKDTKMTYFMLSLHLYESVEKLNYVVGADVF